MNNKSKQEILSKMISHRKDLDDLRDAVLKLFGAQETGKYFIQIERMFDDYVSVSARLIKCERVDLVWMLYEGWKQITIDFFVRSKCDE